MSLTATTNTHHWLLKGPVGSALLRLTLPIMLANLLQASYQLTDIFWIGRLGTTAMAAVTISFPVTMVVLAAGAGFAVVGMTLAAQHAGAGKQNLLNHVAAQSLLMISVVASLFGLCGYWLSSNILYWLGTPQEIQSSALGFMRISFIGIIFVFIYAMFQALMRGVGQLRIPLLILSATVVLNFVLDPLLIFGWGIIPPQGVMGAALATLFTQALATIIAFAVLLSGRQGIQVTWQDFAPDLAYIKRAFLMGVPASMELLTRSLGPMIMATLVTGAGTLALAAYGLGSSILQVITIPAMSLSMAIATLYGQNWGAGNKQRAIEIAWLGALSGFIFLSLVGIVAYIYAPTIVAFLMSQDVPTLALSTHFLRIMCLSWGAVALQLCIISAFRAAGNMTKAMIITVASQLLFQPLLAWLLFYHTTLAIDGLWWAFPINNLLFALVSIAWFMHSN